MLSKTNKRGVPKLEAAGIYGYESVESVIFAALVSADPLLLIGRCGTGKTFLLNRLSEALQLDHRHYNASLISFDDLVGFPYPSEDRTAIQYLRTPATVWGAESVLIDEISRCKPEHQNRLFSLVQEKRVQGIELDKLIYRWAAMNPCGPDQGSDFYEGSEALDQALADRFGFIVEVPDWEEMSDKTHRAIASADDSRDLSAFAGALQSQLKLWRSKYARLIADPDGRTVEYSRIASNELGKVGFRLSPRRVRQLVKNISALLSVRGSRGQEQTYQTALNWGLPHRGWGDPPSEHVIRSIHRTAWDATSELTDMKKWLSEFHLERRIAGKVEKLLSGCPDTDTGTLAVAQLLANEPKSKAATFAYATYPAALAGKLKIGSEGISELGKAAADVLNVSGSYSWTTYSENSESPDFEKLQRVLNTMSGRRRERAAQLFNYLLINELTPEDPVALEEEFNECVTKLRSAKQ